MQQIDNETLQSLKNQLNRMSPETVKIILKMMETMATELSPDKLVESINIATLQVKQEERGEEINSESLYKVFQVFTSEEYSERFQIYMSQIRDLVREKIDFV